MRLSLHQTAAPVTEASGGRTPHTPCNVRDGRQNSQRAADLLRGHNSIAVIADSVAVVANVHVTAYTNRRCIYTCLVHQFICAHEHSTMRTSRGFPNAMRTPPQCTRAVRAHEWGNKQRTVLRTRRGQRHARHHARHCI